MLQISQKIIRRFGTSALNIRITDKDPVTQQRLDSNLNRYGHLFRSFVLKRRLLRSQIWPKIHIIDQVPQEQKPHLKYQSLFMMKKSMHDDTMKIIAKNDPSKINSAFIISNFCQDYFKEMIDQYVGKILVSGKSATDEEKVKKVEQKVMELYKSFYFGEKISPLERQLEQAYLSAKQFKHMKAQNMKRANRTMIQLVKWTERDQRIVQQKQNWQPSDPKLSDINYRNYFVPLQIPSRKQYFLKLQKLQTDWNWFQELKFKYLTSKHYDPLSSHYYDWIQDKIFIRIMNHVRSTQFTTALNIPHDYMIQAQMVQIHFWLVIDRIREFQTKMTDVLARRLAMSLSMEMVRSAQSVNVKKANVLTSSLERMIETNSSILELHFKRSSLTKDNPYKGIDAMVWSIAMAEKIHRYSDQIYLFSDYLIQNYNHMRHHTLQDILNGTIQFDPYLIHPNHRKTIQAINPPLSSVQFQKQFNSNDQNKDYYYSKIQKQMQDTKSIDKTIKQTTDISFSFGQFMQPFRNLRIKYMTLGTMDHFGSMEQQKKEREQRDRKGTWRSEKDQVERVKREFQSIQSVKNKRRRIKEEEGEGKS